MSKSDRSANRASLFDDWVVQEFLRTGGFTALIVLMRIGDIEVVPLRSSYAHVIGDEINWAQLSSLLAQAGVKWDGVLLQSETAKDGGPLSDAAARIALRDLEQRVSEDRLTINDRHFFDQWGRRLKVEPALPQ